MFFDSIQHIRYGLCLQCGDTHQIETITDWKERQLKQRTNQLDDKNRGLSLPFNKAEIAKLKRLTTAPGEFRTVSRPVRKSRRRKP